MGRGLNLPIPNWREIRAGKFRRILISAVVVFLLISFYFLALHRPPKGGAVELVIKPKTPTSKIAHLLVEKKILSEPYLFRFLLRIKGIDILPGKYRFRRGMSHTEVLNIFLQGPLKKIFMVTIPEGFTTDQIVERIGVKTEINAEEFRQLAKNGTTLGIFNYDFLKSNATPGLEGYLFPKTYIVIEDTTPKQFIDMLLTQFEKEISSLNWSEAEKRNLTLHNVITVASLVEREAKVPEERSLISAVIYNRLNKGMPLQIDATVQYALPRWKPKLSKEDLKIDSPYNTYLHPGLPPGPICNPGLESIRAALNPAQVDYLYYVVTDPEGRHTFTNSYEEFLKAKRKAKSAR